MAWAAILLGLGTGVLAYQWPQLRPHVNTNSRTVIAFMVLGVIAFCGAISYWLPTMEHRNDAVTPVVSGPLPLPDVAYLGIAWQMFIRLNEASSSTDKYLFDIGGKNKSRLRAYVAPDNAFILSVSDAHGQTYAARAEPGRVPLNQRMYLACNLGLGPETVLQVFVNSFEVASYVLRAKIDAYFGSPIDLAGAIVGADVNEGNGGYFDLYEQIVLPTTLTESQRQQFVRMYISNPIDRHSPTMRFQGKECMRIGASLHLEACNQDSGPVMVFEK